MTSSSMVADGRTVPWWAVLLQGIAALILGIMLISAPGSTTVFLIQVLGWYWLISGIFGIVSIFVDRTGWGWKLFSGILGIIVGTAVVNHPLWSTILVPTTLVWMMGLFGMIIGVIGLIQGFKGGGIGSAILGILSFIFGLLLIMNPLKSALALPWVFGIFGIVGGIIAIIASFRMPRK